MRADIVSYVMPEKKYLHNALNIFEPSESYNDQVGIWCFESNDVSLGEYFYVSF